MAVNRYVGRGDKTKRYLSDPEVLSLYQQRRSAQADAMALLDAEFDRDPVPHDMRTQSHLFLLAEPSAGRPEMLLSIVEGDGWQQRLHEFARRAVSSEVQKALAAAGFRGFATDIDGMQSFARRPNGAALTTYGLAEGRVMREDTITGESLGELEVHEDGGLRIFTSRLSSHVPNAGTGEQVIFDVTPVLFARRLIALSVATADQAGYFGNWILAVGATGLEGRQSLELSQQGWGARNRYAGETYRRATTASYAELTTQPGAIADRLVGRLR